MNDSKREILNKLVENTNTYDLYKKNKCLIFKLLEEPLDEKLLEECNKRNKYYKDNMVLVSELQVPDDFKTIWEKGVIHTKCGERQQRSCLY